MTKRAISRGLNKFLEQARFSPDLDRVISESDAATLLGLSKDTLRRRFRDGASPPRVRLSLRRIGYRLSDLRRFVEQHLEKPASAVRR
jgi:predicted DNA-binding transcriptional regulator AlpA